MVVMGLALAACGPKPDAALLGHWTGGFEPKSGSEVYAGYVHLYATGQGFKLELKSRDQTISGSGTWTLKGHTVTLLIQDLESDQPDQDVVFAKKLKVIDLDTIRSQFGRQILLRVAADSLSLEGLPMTLGKVEGRLEFQHIVRPTGFDKT
jgi:hypothetical protein